MSKKYISKINKDNTNIYLKDSEARSVIPSSQGTSGQILSSAGTGNVPVWTEQKQITAGNIVGEFSDEAQFAYRPTAGAVDIESGKADKGAKLEAINGETIAWNQLAYSDDLYVDMGLPSGTFWARGNICKDSQGNYSMGNPSNYGCYFSWGNIDGHNGYSEDSYSFDQTNYNESPGAQLTANIASNDATHDAALAQLGDGWHMPTKENFQELFNANNCTWEWTTVNGHAGYLVTSKTNGNTLFFPASGYRDGSALTYRGSIGYYWSSSFYHATLAYYLYFNSGGVSPANNGYYRRSGLAIRPVIKKGIFIDNHNKKYLADGNNNIFDLTRIYGEGNEPSSLEAFEADYQMWFGKPLTYEAYDEGSLKSAIMIGLKTIGFNQYNGSAIKVIGGLEYQITGTYTSIELDGEAVTPDENGKFTPSSGGSLTVIGGGSDTCVHFVHSGSRDGEHEPYWTSTLNADVTILTGKLNGEGSSVVVFADGMKKYSDTVYDEIVSVGNVTKAYKKVNSQSITGVIGDTITLTGCDTTATSIVCGKEIGTLSNGILTLTADATNEPVYYPLATSQEYILDDFELPQVYDVDDYGTEQILLGNGIAPTLDIKYGINAPDTIKNLPHNYVSAVGEQNFTDAQKARARKNIGVNMIEQDIQYLNVYIGAAAASSTIMTSAYLHSRLVKGRPVSITASTGNYLWVISPSAQSDPFTTMEGLEVPMQSDGTTTINNVSYKVWKSKNTYNGTFNIQLF